MGLQFAQFIRERRRPHTTTHTCIPHTSKKEIERVRACKSCLECQHRAMDSIMCSKIDFIFQQCTSVDGSALLCSPFDCSMPILLLSLASLSLYVFFFTKSVLKFVLLLPEKKKKKYVPSTNKTEQHPAEVCGGILVCRLYRILYDHIFLNLMWIEKMKENFITCKTSVWDVFLICADSVAGKRNYNIVAPTTTNKHRNISTNLMAAVPRINSHTQMRKCARAYVWNEQREQNWRQKHANFSCGSKNSHCSPCVFGLAVRFFSI